MFKKIVMVEVFNDPIKLLATLILTQLVASLIVDHLGYNQLEVFRRILSCHCWEHEGAFYQQYFGVKKWKDRLPEMGSNTPSQFRKNKMESTKVDYLYQFILETVRAELCHGLSFAFGLLIIINNQPRLMLMAILYIVSINIPFIIIQRYNRPRLEKLLEKISNSTEEFLVPVKSLYN
ncbi:MAG: hypothetical protein WCR02_06305 [Sphaerochaetaceae bacterium]